MIWQNYKSLAKFLQSESFENYFRFRCENCIGFNEIFIFSMLIISIF